MSHQGSRGGREKKKPGSLKIMSVRIWAKFYVSRRRTGQGGGLRWSTDVRCGRPPAWGITVWLSRVIPPRELHLVHGVRRCDQLVVEMLGSSKGAEKDGVEDAMMRMRR